MTAHVPGVPPLPPGPLYPLLPCSNPPPTPPNQICPPPRPTRLMHQSLPPCGRGMRCSPDHMRLVPGVPPPALAWTSAVPPGIPEVPPRPNSLAPPLPPIQTKTHSDAPRSPVRRPPFYGGGDRSQAAGRSPRNYGTPRARVRAPLL